MIRPFNRDKLIQLVTAAFRDVHLDGGVSLRQAEVMDNYGRDDAGREVSHREFKALYHLDIINDWRAIPPETLDEYPYLAYMDAKGFRYYIPAFMLGELAENGKYVGGAIFALHPEQDKSRSSWDHSMMHYSLLNDEQRAAVAIFLEYVPLYSELSRDEAAMTKRALENYWHQFLPPAMKLD